MMRRVHDDTYDRLTGPADGRAVLLRGAAVLTMDPAIGDFGRADVLIRGSHIVDIGPDLSYALADPSVIAVDLSGHVLVPGFQDTHRHCWQNQLRRLIPDCDHNSAYLAVMNNWLGPLYTPEDVYVGNLVSALGCLDAGITTVLDFSHNPRTPDHSDQAIAALQKTGIRAVHTTCGVMGGEFSTTWPGDAERLRDTYFSSDDQLLTLRMGAIAGDFARPEIALGTQSVEFARNLGISFASDGVLGPAASDRVEALGRAGLLGPDVLLIHCLDLSDDAWRMIADNGVGVSIPTTSDATIGIAEAVPSIQRALDFGIRPSLSVDVEVCLTGDMFTQMRSLMNIQRMTAFERRYRGDTGFPEPLTTRDVLEFATIGGARAIGLDRTTGSITPGKRADLVAIDALDWNTLPLNNAFGTVVTAAETRNVDFVVVDGELKKWGDELVGWDLASVRTMVESSRDGILARADVDLDVLTQRFGLVEHYT
ncbi:amidohydrolase family protein [Streptomyces sp. NPDC013178]|uniref:amidohydrolase family protein n=1 Tax=Streptomyces sp. NPDC013178 TaxID=3155118 RepID=UPI0033FC0327